MSKIVQFAREELRLELAPVQAEVLAAFEIGGYQQAVWQIGRRGGKSLLADVLALFDVALRDHLRAKMRLGELRVAAIICPRIEQAQQHIATCRNLIDQSSRLGKMLVGESADELLFSNGAAIRAYPCSARGIRGAAWSSAILDELGHFIDGTDGNAAGDRILEAAIPALAQFGADGWLSAISTPRWRQGAFWRLVERAQSGRFVATIHYVHKSTAEMNPRIPSEWLEERRREDPDLYAREFQAEFIDGAASYLPSVDVIACLRAGERTLAPIGEVSYVATLDPAYSHDAFAMAIAHPGGRCRRG